ncbi:Protein of unknown function [Gryllus bimaculatus]|nr:Protein of unknown function [Gryllus bimaculatus]
MPHEGGGEGCERNGVRRDRSLPEAGFAPIEVSFTAAEKTRARVRTRSRWVQRTPRARVNVPTDGGADRRQRALRTKVLRPDAARAKNGARVNGLGAALGDAWVGDDDVGDSEWHTFADVEQNTRNIVKDY